MYLPMLSVYDVAVNAAAAPTVNANNVKDVGLKDAPLPSLFPVEPAQPAPVSMTAMCSIVQLPVSVLMTAWQQCSSSSCSPAAVRKEGAHRGQCAQCICSSSHKARLCQLSTVAALPCSRGGRLCSTPCCAFRPRMLKHFKQALVIALCIAVACCCAAAGCPQDACCYCWWWSGRAVNSSGAAGPGVSTALGQPGQEGTMRMLEAYCTGREGCQQQFVSSQPMGCARSDSETCAHAGSGRGGEHGAGPPTAVELEQGIAQRQRGQPMTLATC